MAAAAPALHIEPLSDRHDRQSFASGVEPLDTYLRQRAGPEARRRVATCFVLVGNDEHVPIGYYTLAATDILLAELPEPLAKRLPSYPMVPATLMGRLERIPFEWNISVIGDVVGAFVRAEAGEQVAEGIPKSGDGSGSALSQERFELGEGLLDGIEIGAIGRQVDEHRAAGLDRLSHAGDFVAREIVHNHDVTRGQRRSEDLFHIGEEHDAVDGAVNYQRGSKAGGSQSRNEGRSLPVAMRDRRDHTLPTWSTSIATSHIGCCPGLVDEDQALGV